MIISRLLNLTKQLNHKHIHSMAVKHKWAITIDGETPWSLYSQGVTLSGFKSF